jgi:hypothetical protein
MLTDEDWQAEALINYSITEKKYAIHSVKCASGCYRVSLMCRILGWVKTDALIDDIEFD